MNYPKYQTLSVSTDYTVYTFTSSGPNGNFEIEVQFTLIEETDYYNLGFGALDDNRQIDDTIILNNGDRDKILATIAGFLNQFLDTYPNRQVYFSGSTPSRTRLYRRAISINYDSLQEQFDILGIIETEQILVETFKPSIDYDAFLILKKIITFE